MSQCDEPEVGIPFCVVRGVEIASLPLRGVYPERGSSVAEPALSGEILPLRFLPFVRVQGQNDKRRRAQGSGSLQ